MISNRSVWRDAQLLYLLPVDVHAVKTVTWLNSMILGFRGAMVRASEILEIVCSNIRCEKDRTYQCFAKNPEFSWVISFLCDRMNFQKTTSWVFYVAFMTCGQIWQTPMSMRHFNRGFLLQHRKAKQEGRSHNAVIRVLSFHSLPGLFALELSEELSHNQLFFQAKTKKSA